MSTMGMRTAMGLFGQQDGMATVGQLVEAGVSRSMIDRKARSAEWERVASGVVGIGGMDWTWRRRARRALLVGGPEACLAGPAACRLSEIDGYDTDERLLVTAPRGVEVVAAVGAIALRSMQLRPQDCVVVDGLRCVMRPVALIQVAAIDGVDAAGRALDSMLRCGDSAAWIRSVAQRWKGRGVAGPPTVLSLLDERVDGRLPRSWFQRLAKRAIAARGITLVDEYRVDGPDGRRLADLDLAIPELQIGVECQSWRWHATPTARAADAARKRRLRLLGWELVEVWWSDLHHLDEVMAELLWLIDRRAA